MRVARSLTFLSALLALTFARPVSARRGYVIFRTLSIEQGLFQSIVNAMVQDRQGFMWFVTEDGLNRYDGYAFTTFKHDAKDPSSLTHNDVHVHDDGTLTLAVGDATGHGTRAGIMVAVMKGLFARLRTEMDLPHEETRFSLGPGDTVLMVSDGATLIAGVVRCP
jgi:ligand-binding sensor domain-containing protein